MNRAVPAPRRAYDVQALVLQGGGALGAYQAGVYQGLHEAGIEPDWVAGISIGALNAALLAGNPPADRLDRLRTFWEAVCQPAWPVPALDWAQDQLLQLAPHTRALFSGFEAWRAVVEGQQAFFQPRGIAPWLGGEQGVAQASFYDTRALRHTLERLVDFDRLNDGPVRVSVGAVNVRTGNLQYFDTLDAACRHHSPQARTRLRAEHVMASGALPPAFAAVEIDGEHYWDGGLVSNTPLDHVLGATPRRSLHAFQVDLWSARGDLPENVYDAMARQKDIQYSSRTRASTDAQAGSQHMRRLLHELLALLPAGAEPDNAWVQRARALACDQHFAVTHLIYREKAWESSSKDYEFSLRTMREHWASGLDDIRQTLAHPDWLRPDVHGAEFVTHDRLRGARTAGG
ncbi:MAG: hypothetical protein CFE45_11270 [Burkholderiales bacterium PBB5]|nr:MAG: hypothetical protein CFE45_11270 [Burkholderiales bacterium PBB5]